MVRPGLIFCALYAWNASTGGRFLAPYLRRSLPDSSSIGAIISCQMMITSILGGSGGRLADKWERKNPYRGRLNVMRLGIFLGMCVSLLEGIGNYSLLSSSSSTTSNIGSLEILGGCISFWWNLLLRSGYSISVAFTGPVIDGLVLSHLKNEGNNHSTDGYGRERLHGAIWWGVSNIVIGIACDHLGFDMALFVMILLTSLICFIALSVYESSVVEQYQRSIQQRQQQQQDENHNGESSMLLADDCQFKFDNIDSVTQKKGKEVEVQPIDSEVVEVVEQSLWVLLVLVISTPRRASFLLSFFLLNIGMAVVENLIFLFYASTLGSSQTMCGLSVLSTILLEIPIFYASPWLLKTIGPRMLLGFACLAYILRTIGYILVPRMGFIVLSLDLLHGISYACSQTAGVEFMARIIPDSYEASGQGLLLLIRGLGATLGLLSGGMIEDALGGRGLYGFLCGIVSFGLVVLVFTSCLVQEEATNLYNGG
eukprot:CAMPEP_0176499666 /NCGR_PEP_ID=MMETSP0200_2-20121128/13061_1 /TAXON_ID=947934 /ORGANISM="Chaetoceros sp., Strain GSL56" /LENGTH=482 /DNA_ID=CAMNT_0017898125 /DNA_START=157 /DNA_END=1605 /DNA_ORIENTATION=+